MRISENHKSLGCEQPSRPRCYTSIVNVHVYMVTELEEISELEKVHVSVVLDYVVFHRRQTTGLHCRLMWKKCLLRKTFIS